MNDSKNSGASTEDVYKSKWYFFDILDSFLRPQVIPRRSTTNHVSSIMSLFYTYTEGL